MNPKKIPERMCVSCREMKPKKELIRVVKTSDGSAAIDAGGKAAGRGAYICKRANCVKMAKRRRVFERNLSIMDSETLFPSLFELCEGYEQQ